MFQKFVVGLVLRWKSGISCSVLNWRLLIYSFNKHFLIIPRVLVHHGESRIIQSAPAIVNNRDFERTWKVNLSFLQNDSSIILTFCGLISFPPMTKK